MRSRTAIFLVVMGVVLGLPRALSAQWEKAGSPKGGWITSFAVGGTNLFASTRQGGVFRSTDNAKTWKKVNSGLPKRTDFQCLALNGDSLFAGSVGRGVFRSTDNGGSWTAVNPGLPLGASVWRLETVGSDLFAAVGADGAATVYRSSDNGDSWSPANEGLTLANIMCLEASGPNLFAGGGIPFSGKEGGVFLSTNKGASWIPVKKGLPPNAEILCLAANGPNLFTGTWAMGRVFFSKNNGGWWTNASEGLPDPINFSLSSLAVSGPNLFLGSFRGVFVTSVDGGTWVDVSAGLSDKASIYSLAANESYLFAGTEEGQVWRLPLSDLSLTANLTDPVLTDIAWKEIRKNAPHAVFIPKVVKAAMQEGLDGRQGRRDIPFTIFKSLVLPIQSIPGCILLYDSSQVVVVNLPPREYAVNDWRYAILFFKAKNADMGYAPEPPDPDSKEKQGAAQAASVHKAFVKIFIEFRQTDASEVSRVVREVCIPASFEEDSTTYDPDLENWYSIGYNLRPGKYTVVMAVATQDRSGAGKRTGDELANVGIAYADIELAGPESYRTALETTSIFFIGGIKQTENKVFVTSACKGHFLWSSNEVIPLVDNVVPPGSQLEVVYNVFGATPEAGPGQDAKYDIEVAYSVLKEDGQVAILWTPESYTYAIVSQRLPLGQTIMAKDDKGERQEARILPAGNYTLVIHITDKVTGLEVEKQVPFEIR